MVNCCVVVSWCVLDMVHAADRGGLMQNDGAKSNLHGEHDATWATMKNHRFATRCCATGLV